MGDARSDAYADVMRVTAMIEARSEESQNRIAAVVAVLRGLLESEARDEIELAFTLVMAELAHDLT